MTSPFMLNSGPPELPGLTAASVWMNGTYEPSGSERDLALTIPAVTVFSKPYGEPIATTHSPTFTSSAAGSFTVGRSFASIFSTATSLARSKPTTLALYSRLSVSFTVTTDASATTCALVRITPSGLMMKPDPRPRIGISLRGCGIPNWRKNCDNGSSGSARERSWEKPVFSSFEVTLMLTTAGPCCWTIEVKFGNPAGLTPGAAEATTAGAGVAASAVDGDDAPSDV